MEMTIWVKIPVKVEYEPIKGEPMTRDYPGTPDEIEIGEIKWPGDKNGELGIDIYLPWEDALIELAWDDLKDKQERGVKRWLEK